MSGKVEKTIARQQEKIKEGQYYEAQQQCRTIAARYIKSAQYDLAIQLLYEVSQLLLSAGQGGSGADLALYMIEVYIKAELKPDAGNRARILSILRAFPKGEPMMKRFVGEAVGWTSRNGEFPAGDPEVHHVAGSLFAEADEPYEAERHLILGTKDSPEVLARLEYDWYSEDEEPSTAPLYAARSVLPYLITGNLRAANQSFLLFTRRLSSTHPGLGVQEVSSSSSDLRVYPSLPLLNFLGLLLLAVQRGEASLFRLLKTHYAANLKDLGGAWDDALAQIGESYFGIRIPSASNPMFDMMGSLLGMGGGGASKDKKKTLSQGKGRTDSPAPPGVD